MEDHIFSYLDRSILLWVNGWDLPPWLSEFLIAFTNANNAKWFFTIAIPLGVGLFIYHLRWRGLQIALLAGLLAGASDLICYRVIKSLYHRDRPQHVMEEVVLRLQHNPGSSSLPSNHAATTMALAIWFSLLFPRWAPLALAVSFLTGLSRLYVGVHYPSDILAGWLLGGALGFLFFKLWKKQELSRSRLQHRHSR